MSARIAPATTAKTTARKVAAKPAPKPAAAAAKPAPAKPAPAKPAKMWGQRMSEATAHPTKLDGAAGSFRQFTADNAAQDGWEVVRNGDKTTFSKGNKVITVTYSAQHYARHASVKVGAAAPRPLWEGSTKEKWAKVNAALQG